MNLLFTGHDPQERLAALKNNLDCACRNLDAYMQKINLLPEDERFLSGTAEVLITIAFEYGRLYDDVFPGQPKDRLISYFTQKSLDTLLPRE